MSSPRRTFLIRAAACLATALYMPLATAGKLRKLRLRISANSAPAALAEFVRQTGLQVLYDFDAVRDFSTREVTGELRPEEALAVMFEGSGLVFEFINDRTIAVRPRRRLQNPLVEASRGT